MLCGVDEAGRGPVLGPMVVAAVMVEDDRALRELKVRDSKQLTPKKREILAPKIREVARVEIAIVPPVRIDEMTSDHMLNELEAETFASLIELLAPDTAYVDACDPNERSFKRMVRRHLTRSVEIVCEHKADVTYPVVSAASIIAKTTRDEEIRRLEEEIGEKIGTGYAHDPTTRALLEKWIKEKGEFPPQTRRSWATARKAESMAKNARLSDWND